jgi:hypothetical protein
VKPRPIFLLPPLVMLILCGMIASPPGERIVFILISSTTCILSIGFSGGWPKHTGIALWLLFVAAGLSDIRAGDELHRERKQCAIKHARVLWERELKQRELKQYENPSGD